MGYELASVLAMGVVLAGFGPFGTYDQAPLGERLIYWSVVTLVAYALLRPALRLTGFFTAQGQRNQAAARIAVLILISFPLTLLVWVASWRHTPAPWPNARQFAGLYPSVVFVTLLLAGLIGLVQALRRDKEGLNGAHPSCPEEEKRSGRCAPRFLSRLPFHMRDELLALEVEDHYVRAYTSSGSALLLMRLSDAVSELDGFAGAQVHRSWWVAAHAVQEVRGPSRARRLVLRNGLAVPVARGRVGVLDQLTGEKSEQKPSEADV